MVVVRPNIGDSSKRIALKDFPRPFQKFFVALLMPAVLLQGQVPDPILLRPFPTRRVQEWSGYSPEHHSNDQCTPEGGLLA